VDSWLWNCIWICRKTDNCLNARKVVLEHYVPDQKFPYFRVIELSDFDFEKFDFHYIRVKSNLLIIYERNIIQFLLFQHIFMPYTKVC
jgi:hypothetical protein